MASNFHTFTITQARMGEPLQFQPALGSKELEALVDAYVPGSATKQDKLSEVTLDFFTHATVDFTTGSLFRQYNVAISPNFSNHAFELSPAQSQSSGFSPPIFTPSPTSSMTFADSGYGSISMTPPTRIHGTHGGRVTKKTVKKDTKKVAEARLPGFSIMTKDGVDVTSSAGRGTKTKEQREHAHLMRIIKACDECKRKKIRCDPSHRRQQTDMSRTSTSSTSSSRLNPSPPVSVPLLSHTSPPELPSFGNSAIDDFVLFPEDSTSWNPADLSIPEFDENLDLSQFNFDISGLDNFSPMSNITNQPFDLSYIDQQPFVPDQYGLDSWASAQGGDLSASHTRPPHSLSSNDSGQLDSIFDSGFSSAESPGSLNTPQSSSSFAENFWSNGSVEHPQIAQSSSVSLPSADVDWSVLESGMNATSPAAGLSPSSSMNRRERRHIERVRSAVIQATVDRVPSANSLGSEPFANPFEQLHNSTGSLSHSPMESWYDQSQPQFPGAANRGSLEYWDLESGLENTRALVVKATQALKSTGGAYQSFIEELQRLQVMLANVNPSDTERTPVLRQALVSELESLTSQLQVLLTRVKNMSTRGSVQRYDRLDPEYRPDHLKELSGRTRRLVSSLCATINNLQSQDTDTGGSAAVTNTSTLPSGNVQLSISPSSPPSTHPQNARVYLPEGSYSSMSSGSSSNLAADLKNAVIVRDGKTIILDKNIYEGDGLSSPPGGNLTGDVAIATIGKPVFRLVTKPAIEQLSRLVDGQSEQTGQAHVEFDTLVSALTFPHQLSSPSASALAFSRPLISTQEVINVRSDTSSNFAVRRLPQESTPTILTEQILARQQTDPTILADADGLIGLSQPIPPTFQILRSQNIGRSRNDSLQNESSSPFAIPGTFQDTAGTYNSGIVAYSPILSENLVSYMVMFASLVLLNCLQATNFLLPLAGLFLAIPRPTLAMIAVATVAVIVAQASPLSDLMSSLKSFVTVALMSIPLLRESTINNGSFGKALSSSRRSLSTLSSPLANGKDAGLLSMFDNLSLGVPATV